MFEELQVDEEDMPEARPQRVKPDIFFDLNSASMSSPEKKVVLVVTSTRILTRDQTTCAASVQFTIFVFGD